MILTHKLFVKKVPQWYNEVRQSNLLKSVEKSTEKGIKNAQESLKEAEKTLKQGAEKALKEADKTIKEAGHSIKDAVKK